LDKELGLNRKLKMKEFKKQNKKNKKNKKNCSQDTSFPFHKARHAQSGVVTFKRFVLLFDTPACNT